MDMNLIKLAKENNVTLESLLVEIAREEVLCAITKAKDKMGIKSPGKLILDKKNAKSCRIMYLVPGEGDIGAEILEEISDILNNPDYMVDAVKFKSSAKDQSIDVDVYINKMYVPLTLELSEVSERYRCKKESCIRLLNEEVFEYSYYTGEEKVAEDLFEIVKKMELLNDFSPVENAYREITENPMEGKRVWVSLKELTKDSQFVMNEDIPSKLLNLGKNTELDRKWDKYRKRQKNTSKNLEITMETIYKFLEPVWKALINDEGFAWDWMPDIGRYL